MADLKEISSIFKVSEHTIRRWQREGLEYTKNEKGNNEYDLDKVLEFVKNKRINERKSKTGRPRKERENNEQ